MSTAMVSSFYDLSDGFYKSHHNAHLAAALQDSRKPRARHPTVTAVPPPSPAAKSPVLTMQHHKLTGLTVSLPLQQQQQQTREHRKLDRSMSEPVTQQQLVQRSPSSASSSSGSGQQANSSRYKTELCRPFEENGSCKYGDKCQFAHGSHELRTLARHPKYKTELCRTFHTTGFCPYGPRCHFIHNSEESKKSLLTSLQHQQSESGGPPVPPPTRPKALSIGSFSLGSAGDLSPPSSLSASPTSLNSFFSDDPFYSPQHHPHHPQACTAFSFSQDFAAALAKTPLSLGHHAGFGGSQPSLSAGPVLQVVDMQDRDVFSFESPPSPVDSLSSELDGLSVGGGGGCGGSPVSCASPVGLLGPRLPIFSRLAISDSE